MSAVVDEEKLLRTIERRIRMQAEETIQRLASLEAEITLARRVETVRATALDDDH